MWDQAVGGGRIVVKLGFLWDVVQVEDALDGSCWYVVSIACCGQAPSPGTDLLDGRGGCWPWWTWLKKRRIAPFPKACDRRYRVYVQGSYGTRRPLLIPDFPPRLHCSPTVQSTLVDSRQHARKARCSLAHAGIPLRPPCQG